jgi:hypothetical protein
MSIEKNADGYLKDHWNYTTPFNSQWRIKVEFVKDVDGIFENQPEYWIKEEDLLKYHEACKRIYFDFNRLPQTGDCIVAIDFVKVVEITFDFEEMILTISVN